MSPPDASIITVATVKIKAAVIFGAVCGTQVEMMLDSGSSVSLLQHFRYLRYISFENKVECSQWPCACGGIFMFLCTQTSAGGVNMFDNHLPLISLFMLN